MLSASFPTELLLLRHAEVHNPRNILYGRLPRFGLSERGREQAQQAARFLSTRPVVAIYSSPLLRARQTAMSVSGYHPHLKIRFSRELLEVRTGYQGSSNDILKSGFSFYEPLMTPGDESMEDVLHRMVAFLQRLIRRHAGETVVVVSHADPIAITRLGLESKPLTVSNLHSVVYPSRASVNQVRIIPKKQPELTYFDVVGDGPT